MGMKLSLRDEIRGLKKYRELLSTVKPFHKTILAVISLNLLIALVSLISPYLFKPIIDVGVMQKNLRVFLFLACVKVALYLFNEVLGLLKTIFLKRSTNRLMVYLSKAFIKHLYSFDLSFFQSNTTMRANHYLGQLDGIIVDQIPAFIVSLIRIFAVLIICFWMNFEITILAFLLSPVILIHRLYFTKKDRILSNSFEDKSQDISAKISDSFSRVQVIKYFSKEKREIRNFIHNLIEKIRIMMQIDKLSLTADSTEKLLGKIVIGAVFLYGVYQIHLGLITLGSLCVLILYYQSLIDIIHSCAYQYNSLSRKLYFVDHYLEIMARSPEIMTPADPLPLKLSKGDIEFQKVRFSYDAGNPVLKDVSFKIEGGKWLAVMGRSGIGKTTMFNLILRLFDPVTGCITLDGHNIKKIGLSSLTQNIVIAPQEPLLFNRTFRENIMFSLDEEDEERMIEVAKLCYIDDHIMGLPDKYDTLIKVNASNLSRGQKQRIVLARAIIHNPPILILDEATSSLDADTEKNIYANLKRTRGGLTTLVASHRLATAALADHVIFIKDAQTILTGRLEDLLREEAQFAKLFGQDIPEVYLKSDSGALLHS